MILPDPSLPWPIVKAGVYIIAERERLRLKAYLCPAGVWTIGWGETDGVHPGDTCTKEQADRWMCDDLTDRTKSVLAMCTVPPNDNQLAALVSLAYNIGLRQDKPRKRGLYHSSVLKAHNRGDFAAASRAFDLLNMAVNPKTGQKEVLPGLTTRRAMEKALYLTPCEEDQAQPMPQAVEPESGAAASPINQAGATGVVVATIKVVGDNVEAVSGPLAKAKALAVDLLGAPVDMLPWFIVAAVCGLVIWHRVKQRREGWA